MVLPAVSLVPARSFGQERSWSGSDQICSTRCSFIGGNEKVDPFPGQAERDARRFLCFGSQGDKRGKLCFWRTQHSLFRSRSHEIQYDFVAWPASKYMPVELMNLEGMKTPWSVNLGKEYDEPSAEHVKVTLTRRNDGRTWVLKLKTLIRLLWAG